MKILWLALLCLNFSAQAEVCGIFKVEDFGDQILTSLIDLKSKSPMTLNYSVANPTAPIVQKLVNGLCYCVEGQSAPDPSNPGDNLYQVLTIEGISKGPRPNCE